MERQGLLEVVHLVVHDGEVVERQCRVGMLGAGDLLLDRHGQVEEPLGFGVPLLFEEVESVVAGADGRLAAPRAVEADLHLQGPGIVFVGGGILPLPVEHHGQRGERLRDRGMLPAKRFDRERDRLRRQPLRRHVHAACHEPVGLVVHLVPDLVGRPLHRCPGGECEAGADDPGRQNGDQAKRLPIRGPRGGL